MRRVVIYDGDKKIYDGPDNRSGSSNFKFWYLSPDTWIKIIGFIVLAAVFFVRTEDFMKTQVKLNEFMVNFVNKSDAYHSAFFGVQFEHGAPNGKTLPTIINRSAN